MTHKFVWWRNGLFTKWYGRHCKILVSRKRKVLVVFENGERCVTMLMALRKLKEWERLEKVAVPKVRRLAPRKIKRKAI